MTAECKNTHRSDKDRHTPICSPFPLARRCPVVDALRKIMIEVVERSSTRVDAPT